MESIGSAIWYLAFLVQYGALVTAVVSVGILSAYTVFVLVRNKVRVTGALDAAPVAQTVEGTPS